MPWDNNNGGGPWGQSPGTGGGRGPRRPGGGSGGSGGGGNTPNLEDILNRGRQQFGGNMPGGRWIAIGVLLAVIVFWLFQSVYTVAPQEIGVELRFGQPKDEFSDPGLHFHWWPVETVETVNITENQTRIASLVGGRSDVDDSDGLMLTGDQNIVDVAFSVLWRVTDPAAYLFNVEAPDEILRRTAESAMREVVGRRPAQDIYRDERAAITVEVRDITQEILESYGAGIEVSNISIENVAPPAEVADAFDEVQRAEQDEDRFQEEARAYANTLLGEARGQAAQLREEAAAYKDRVVKESEGEAARFVSIYREYANAPEVTRKRMFLETMERVLGQSQKIIIEEGASGGSGVVPYLPLDQLRRGNVPSSGSQGAASQQTGGQGS